MELFSNVVIERDFPEEKIKSILNHSQQATGHQHYVPDAFTHQPQDYYQSPSSSAGSTSRFDPGLYHDDHSAFWSQISPSNSSSTSPSSQT
ncbi:hypothetical protein FPSE5266_20204 [Fusarium pseudograminearum]|nr:hypothetical protein FPSE5266_20204 [Fusarium pseudograminearum]